MASCPIKVRWLLDSNLVEAYPSGAKCEKGNILQNIPLKRNGRQSPQRDDDMNGWCVKTWVKTRVKTRQDREDNRFVELIYKFQGFWDTWFIVELIYKLPSLEKYQLIFEWLENGKSRSTADWLATTFVDILLFHARPRTDFEMCGV